MYWFDVLGVNENASSGEIKAAYKRLMKTVHPDVQRHSPNQVDLIVKYQDAYRQGLLQAKLLTPKREPIQRDIHKTIRLTIEQAVGGATIAIPEASGLCATCGGIGKVQTEQPVGCLSCHGGAAHEEEVSRGLLLRPMCSECSGVGVVSHIICASCDGHGVSDQCACNVTLPPHVRTGDTFTIEGGATVPHLGLIGNIHCDIEVFDPNFTLCGNDLHCDVELDLWDVALGCVKQLTLPGGSTVYLPIDGGVRVGSALVYRSMGVVGPTGTRGDLFLKVSQRPFVASSPLERAALLALKGAVASPRSE